MVDVGVELARRQLRTIRVRDAFSEDMQSQREKRFRDSLLLYLGEHIMGIHSDEPSLDAVVDAAICVALSRIDESDLDYLVALSLAAEILAEEGEFARLHLLASSFEGLAKRLATERPYLSAFLSGFEKVVRGRRDDAVGTLTYALGLRKDVSTVRKQERSLQSVGDIFLANALLQWLRDEATGRVKQAHYWALQSGDGSLHGLSRLLIAYAESAGRNASERMIPLHEPRFGDRKLMRYLAATRFKTLFPAQARAIEAGILSEGSRVLALPTSSGKTFIAELRIIAELERNPMGRVAYLAPYRLLARQVETDLRRSLRHAGLTVRDLGGSYDLSIEDSLLSGAIPDVAIMTPERMDAVMRLANSGRMGSDTAAELLDSLVLVVFDELQLIGRSSRGPRLELFLTRLRQRVSGLNVFGLAASSGGIDALADWLDAPAPLPGHRRPTGTVELLWKTDGTVVQSVDGRPYKVTDLPRPSKAVDAAAELARIVREDHLPVLIIETTRDLAESVIQRIRSGSARDGDRWRNTLSETQREAIDTAAELATATMGQESGLGDILRDGLAYHHAGLPSHLLQAIENLVRMGAIRIVAATTTVAEGAHLPFKVVIIPHLNFPGPTRRIEKDLYLNIVGRAGRVNVSAEGLVVVLDSDAPTLKGHVTSYLWNGEINVDITGQLHNALMAPTSIDSYKTDREIQSQLLAWLGDDGSYVDDQTTTLASRTFSWQVADERARSFVELSFAHAFERFERQGFATAASPFVLTPLGSRARLAGVGPESCARLAEVVRAAAERGVISDFLSVFEFTEPVARIISRIVFEVEEVVEWSMWFRRQTSPLRPAEEVAFMRALMSGSIGWPWDEDVFQEDLRLFAMWLLGTSYPDIADSAPTFGGRGLFGSEDRAKRTTDAAEYLGRLSYPAAWAWGAAVAMFGEDGDELPSWIRGGIELGVPSETAVELMRTFGISRGGAVLVSQQLPSRWAEAEDLVSDIGDQEMASLGLATSDRRILANRART